MHMKTMASPILAALQSRPASSAKTRSPPEGRDLLRPDSLGIVLRFGGTLERVARVATCVKGRRAETEMGSDTSKCLTPFLVQAQSEARGPDIQSDEKFR
jgi:hypothetical protein